MQLDPWVILVYALTAALIAGSFVALRISLAGFRRMQRSELVDAALGDLQVVSQEAEARVNRNRMLDAHGEPVLNGPGWYELLSPAVASIPGELVDIQSVNASFDSVESLLRVTDHVSYGRWEPFGWTMLRAMKSIHGEEKEKLAGNKEFFARMTISARSIRNAVRTDNTAGAYQALADFVVNAVGRGKDSEETRPETRVDNQRRFLDDLRTCASWLREARNSPAERLMTTWQSRWRQPGSNGNLLPTLALPLALAASDGVIDLYGEPLVFQSTFADQRSTTVAALLEKTAAVLAEDPPAPERALETLAEWRKLVPSRPSPKGG